MNGYRITVTLADIEPPIWRTLQVPSNVTLGQLHMILQAAMGWSDRHLHRFVIGAARYGRPIPDFDFGDPEDKDENTAVLSRVVEVAGKFHYEYDFGDSWQHEINVEAVCELPAESPACCLDGGRACPPEDCGGVPGYEDMLTVLRNPNHEEYETTIQWLGRRFAPERFDLKVVNRRLQRLGRGKSDREQPRLSN